MKANIFITRMRMFSEKAVMKNLLVTLFLGIIFLLNVKLVVSQAYMDPSVSIEKRVENLVSLLTLEEKVAQLNEKTPAIPRLGVPAYNWWNEALHGVARSGDTLAVFPQAIGLAATFNPRLLQKVGQACGEQARAIYNKELLDGSPGGHYKGLTFWSPNINIFRDPRWGRGHETYGEDPFLTGQMGMAFVNGIQGDHPDYLLASACAKHFAVHSGPEYLRHEFDALVSDYDLWNTYLPAFHDLIVKSKVTGVMCAYNRLNGEPCCGDPWLMQDLLRDKWGFEGYVTSDCGAINWMWKFHQSDSNAMGAAVRAINNGTDLECGQFWSHTWEFNFLAEAVEKGVIDESVLDNALKNLFAIRFRLGMFDPPSVVPFSSIPYEILKSDKHHDLASQSARESMVLLKNNGILPLSKNIKSIAIVGPNADNQKVLLANYHGIPPFLISAVDGIKKKLGTGVSVFSDATIDYVTPLSGKNTDSIVQRAAQCDVIVFVGGISADLEGESGDAGKQELDGFKDGDRTSIALPKIQTSLMKMLKATGKPLVFVNMSGSAMAIPWEADNADAILQAWYGGEHGGNAIADILFGDYNPSGRLPLTFYKSDADLPDYSDYSMQNRTYRYFRGDALFPFGFGLSYTSFSYSNFAIDKGEATLSDSVRVTLTLTNIGKMAGAEVVQLYASKPESDEIRAFQELKAFRKVYLKPGESKEVSLILAISDMASYLESKKAIDVESGTYLFSIGSSSDHMKGEVSILIKDNI
jgi:beta-glucosidase